MTQALARPAEQIRNALSLLGGGKRSVREMRTLILGLEAAMLAMPEHVPGKDFETTHRFDTGIYMRECVIPKGFVVTGRIHKHGHWNYLLRGTITVWTEEGMRTLKAPAAIQSNPGIKRVGFAHEETVWMTVHSNPSDDREIARVEERLFAETFEEAYLASSRSFDDAIHFLGLSPAQVQELSENTKDQALFQYNEYLEAIEIRESPIHGKGMFARVLFTPGDIIAPARVGGKRTPAGRYCNHSGAPNAEMQMTDNGNVYLVALETITPGAEILNDYYLSFERTREKEGEALCLQ